MVSCKCSFHRLKVINNPQKNVRDQAVNNKRLLPQQKIPKPIGMGTVGRLQGEKRVFYQGCI